MKVSRVLGFFASFISTSAFSSQQPTTAETNTCAAGPSSTSMPKYRTVRRVMERPYQHWVGDGFHVFPVFADLAFKEDLSPLLMFDYASPKNFPSKVGRPRGVGMHPHRGFETVTIAFQGEIEHGDNKGNQDTIGPGDVQWMTAGRGIVHEEFHSKNFTRNGGTLEMCQLWVNLPKKHKMTKPRYQAITKDRIPTVELPVDREEGTDSLGTIRLIAGEVNDIKGAAKTFSPVQMWDVILPHAGAEVDIPFPADQNCIVFVRRGRVQVLSGENAEGKKSELGPQDVAVMHHDGSDVLRVRVMNPDTSLLVMGGEPLNEPIAAQGPFVMNTQKELSQAMIDYRNGKF
mmetsp:Transcript_63263/g.181958  ORF Transcript_63263/g.181958 Transcript_63263/m.181958 type:complete len:345 (-) Transcript_63263:64-1098(-)